jgi:hypothetical protein
VVEHHRVQLHLALNVRQVADLQQVLAQYAARRG